MSKEPFMYCPKHFAGRLLVWLAAVMLPLQPASVLAGCCDQASRPGTEAKHRPCCGDYTASSVPSKCQCGVGCSCCCRQEKDPPVSALAVPTTRHRAENALPQGLAATCTSLDWADASAELGGSAPTFSILSSAQHCVSLCKLQL